MSDIVKVLRGKHALDYDEKTLDQFCNEAADEIEKLRRENEIMVGMINDMGTIVIKARAALGEKE